MRKVLESEVRAHSRSIATGEADAVAGTYNFLRWPEDFSGGRLSARALHASLGDNAYDGLLVTGKLDEVDRSKIWRTKSVHVLPVIDLTGSLGRCADFDASRMTGEDSRRLEELIDGFHRRRARINQRILHSDDVAEKLLARMFVSDRELTPAFNGGERAIVTYDAMLDPQSVREAAQSLEARGLLRATFFDRAHICDRCRSSRFNVREVCTHCRSANLHEEAYLHHFVCANQGPESDFRQGDSLVCPKCRSELSHFSVDYDKPGSVLKCRTCGAAEFDATVGFVCLDCAARYSGENAPTTDIWSYALTDQGTVYVEMGETIDTGASALLRFSDLPIALVIALDGALRRYREIGVPFTLVEIGYVHESEIVQREGPRQFTAARNLFLENLANSLYDENSVFRARAYDFLLLRGFAEAEVLQGLEQLRVQASDSLRLNIGIDMRAYGSERFT